MGKILLATNNPGKVREFRRLLEDTAFTAVTPAEAGLCLQVEETGSSYAENALLKARAFASAGRCLALADDSGIEVDALDGGPGMLSARYGGPGLDDEQRTALLLMDLAGVPEGQRTARYRAVVALAWPGDTGVQSACFEGVQEGSIAFAARGKGGFGYDPVFLVAGGRTQAELSPEEKDAISHRGQAVRAAMAFLAECPG
ncbi:MAG: non-canonical purine NTP pyrophosphatase, RdgB/HAM1 family [Anaerolinea sp.]|nr:non-canonical purine NTP pyrophosphatase, RdgB/HAM1 family [Anaerolinea sp.]